MSPDAVAAFDSVKFTGLYPKGSLLFVEGEEPRGIFILCSGRAKLTTSSTEGKTLIVKIAEPGEVLGASATILGKPYEVSAETIEPSQLNLAVRPVRRAEAGASWHLPRMSCTQRNRVTPGDSQV